MGGALDAGRAPSAPRPEEGTGPQPWMPGEACAGGARAPRSTPELGLRNPCPQTERGCPSIAAPPAGEWYCPEGAQPSSSDPKVPESASPSPRGGLYGEHGCDVCARVGVGVQR